MKSYEIKQGQSLLDTSIRNTGDAGAALDMAIANGTTITDALEVGAKLNVPDIRENRRNVDYYAQREIHPATALTTDDMIAAPYGGIEFMGIEIDFIVS